MHKHTLKFQTHRCIVATAATHAHNVLDFSPRRRGQHIYRRACSVTKFPPLRAPDDARDVAPVHRGRPSKEKRALRIACMPTTQSLLCVRPSTHGVRRSVGRSVGGAFSFRRHASLPAWHTIFEWCVFPIRCHSSRLHIYRMPFTLFPLGFLAVCRRRLLLLWPNVVVVVVHFSLRFGRSLLRCVCREC